ncbi:hypothetical protein HFD88_001574 [Aspergillus terreus]|nr:hypothetical protein HFD88_001574 [Aspergillus terreus]
MQIPSMETPLSNKWRHLFQKFFPRLDKYVSIYKDLHQHPELPCQESRTAAVVADHVEALGYQVQRNIGGHGVIGVLSNGEGKTVLLRSELDALPIEEDTGLPYASKVRQVDTDGYTKSVVHACGHDMHMASLLGAADLLRNVKDAWSGTLAMIDDGLFDKIPLPDIVLGQHAVPTRAGTIGTRPGRVLGYLGSLAVRIYGKGTHSSTPELGIVSRLQMVNARRLISGNPVRLHFKVDIRSFRKATQTTAVAAVKRIIEGECQTANSPRQPQILTSASCPPIDNDEEATARFTRALHSFYGDDATGKIIETDLDITADDFVLLAHPPGKPPIPYVYWNYGVTPREEYDKAKMNGNLRDLPFNHNPKFAAEIEPSLQAGIEGLAIASVSFFETLASLRVSLHGR